LVRTHSHRYPAASVCKRLSLYKSSYPANLLLLTFPAPLSSKHLSDDVYLSADWGVDKLTEDPLRESEGKFSNKKMKGVHPN